MRNRVPNFTAEASLANALHNYGGESHNILLKGTVVISQQIPCSFSCYTHSCSTACPPGYLCRSGCHLVPLEPQIPLSRAASQGKPTHPIGQWMPYCRCVKQ